MKGVYEVHVKHILFKTFSDLSISYSRLVICLSRLTLIIMSYTVMSCWPDGVETGMILKNIADLG